MNRKLQYLQIHTEDLLEALKTAGVDFGLIGQLRTDFTKHSRAHINIRPASPVTAVYEEQEEL